MDVKLAEHLRNRRGAMQLLIALQSDIDHANAELLQRLEVVIATLCKYQHRLVCRLLGLCAALQLNLTVVGPSVGAVAWWAPLSGFLAGAIMALLFRPADNRRARGR